MLQYAGPKSWTHEVRMMTAASAPPAPILAKMAGFGIDVTHVYGLTEVYGPCVVCEWKEEWDGLPVEEQAALKARQGTRYLAQELRACLVSVESVWECVRKHQIPRTCMRVAKAQGSS